tara:strand:+ start:2426 stop:2953 length:528 start_codon:yes stop_codon:yes gene_type:complete
MKTCNTCDVELTDKNWSTSWKKVERTQCKKCSHLYNMYSNKRRMYINGKYIPQSSPLWKAGNYKSLDDAWSHNKIESTNQGEVYIIVNDAWPEWVKVGKAVSSDDRLNGYQTSSPFRDYRIVAKLSTENRHSKEKEMHKIFSHFAHECKGEWFKINKIDAIKLFNYQVKENINEI